MELLIQTVLDRIDVALLSNQEVVAMDSWISQKDEVRKVLPALDMLLNKTGRHWKDIKKIAVAVGKGNFSSTRIGVTIANTVALASGANIIEFCLEGEKSWQETLGIAQAAIKKGETVTIAQPIYRSEPMISPSKKQKFTE